MPRHFTIAEANEALQGIKPLMVEIRAIREDIVTHQTEIWPAVQSSAGNGGNPTLSRLVKSFDRLDELLHIIQDAGALVKDLNTGLVDFPAMREGQEVYLCWQDGEQRIEYWHEIEAGFSGRQPIESF